MKIFSQETIFLDKEFQSKDEVFQFLAQKSKEIGITNNTNEVFEALWNRENQVSTGMENEIAIPHGQSDAILEPKLFFIKLKNDIEWETFDGSKVKYIFSILVPKTNKDNIHLETLSKVSTMLLDKNNLMKLKLATSEQEIIDLLNAYLTKEKEVVESKGKKVIGITACTVGLAHTYMSAEALENKLRELGYNPKIETRGSVGVKNQLTDQDIQEAEFVVIASDLDVNLDAFNNKKVYVTSTKDAIKNTEQVINKAINAQVHKSNNANKIEKSTEKVGFFKHIITGISYMIPFVIFGGIMIALSLGLGKSIYGNNLEAPQGDFLWYLLQIGVVAFTVMIGILGAYIAYSIAGKAAIMPALVVSMVANNNSLFYNIAGLSIRTPMGFIGAIIFGILIGYTVKYITNLKIQKSLSAVIPMFVIPIGVTLFYSLLVIFLIGAPIGWVMDKFISGLESIFKSEGGLKIGIALVVGALLGGMAGFDMGGPINKVAFLTGSALVTQQIFEPMGMIAAAIPVAPLGMGLATLLFRKKFNEQEKSLGASALVMGFIGISEGAIPFAVSDPKRVITANVIGSAIAGALAGVLSVTNAAAHGGPIVAILGAVGSDIHGKGLGIAFFFLAIVIGTIVTALIYGLWKPKTQENSSSSIKVANYKDSLKNMFKGRK
ncbi:PTS fructose transporter subunit IIABC [Mycoplasma leonicaptivi]|uniref:PTS fructose transporter subunit IIABC n=1 Tax=Mycoplasma leonicaptivi TaxID=36742 RepID=UPI000483B04B|nr:fructose-specific PTS transporter subunit EIIC [Mycoplasma leonicaptivi]